MLRRQCPSWATASQIAEIAKVLSAKKFYSDFLKNFSVPFTERHHRHNVSYLAGKTAEFLVDVIESIYWRGGERCNVEVTRQKRQKYLTIWLHIQHLTLIIRHLKFLRLNHLLTNGLFLLATPLQRCPPTSFCVTTEAALLITQLELLYSVAGIHFMSCAQIMASASIEKNFF